MPTMTLKDRRASQRVKCNFNATVISSNKNLPTFSALLIDLSPKGGRLAMQDPIPSDAKPRTCIVQLGEEKCQFDIKKFEQSGIDGQFSFSSADAALSNLFLQISNRPDAIFLTDRRLQTRRAGSDALNDSERRETSRRLTDLWDKEFQALEEELPAKAQVLFRQKSLAHDEQSVTQRREWLENKINKSLKALGTFAEPTEDFSGNIENLVGVAHVPIGVAGPLRINGGHAKGDFYVPLATTEGVLVNSYTLGMTLITRSGGATVRLLADEMRISPLFIFENARQAIVFDQWIRSNFVRLKEITDSTTQHGKLLRLEAKILGPQVAVLFIFDTGDAMGLNMICKATEAACRYIVSAVKPKIYYLRSNFSSNKKISAFNAQNTYGKALIADVVIPRQLLAIVNTTPEDLTAYSQSRLLTGAHVGMVGNNGHCANGIAAIFIACGQDVAHVANSHVGISSCEMTSEGDLYVSLHLPNLLVGTVGGGTGLATARACLEILDCYGAGKAKKFAEIITATLLAGELSIATAIVNGTYVEAHEKFGRNHPQ